MTKFRADALAYRDDAKAIEALVGATVTDADGMEWMFVASRGRWVVLENEDERVQQVTWEQFERMRVVG